MSATTKLAPGLYLVDGSADADGFEYLVSHAIGGDWVVQDSRGRQVSRHFSKADAIASVEVTR